MWGDKPFEELVGLKILGLQTNPEHTYLSFETDKGFITYYSEGDCCSNSWFENIGGFHLLLDSHVRFVEERAMPESLELEEQGEVIRFYGWTLVTDRGHFDIEMRNSSNGYYGGRVSTSIDKPDDLKYIGGDF